MIKKKQFNWFYNYREGFSITRNWLIDWLNFYFAEMRTFCNVKNFFLTCFDFNRLYWLPERVWTNVRNALARSPNYSEKCVSICVRACMTSCLLAHSAVNSYTHALLCILYRIILLMPLMLLQAFCLFVFLVTCSRAAHYYTKIASFVRHLPTCAV